MCGRRWARREDKHNTNGYLDEDEHNGQLFHAATRVYSCLEDGACTVVVSRMEVPPQEFIHP
jgi:hypothetical protein